MLGTAGMDHCARFRTVCLTPLRVKKKQCKAICNQSTRTSAQCRPVCSRHGLVLNSTTCAQRNDVRSTRSRQPNAQPSKQCTGGRQRTAQEADNAQCKRPTTHNARGRQRTMQEADNVPSQNPTPTATMQEADWLNARSRLLDARAVCSTQGRLLDAGLSARRTAVCSMEGPSASCGGRIAPFGAVGPSALCKTCLLGCRTCLLRCKARLLDAKAVCSNAKAVCIEHKAVCSLQGRQPSARGNSSMHGRLVNAV